MKLKHSLLLLTLTILIAGCGLKGDLYLPDEEPQVVNQPAEESSQDQSEANEGAALSDQPTESSVPQ